ncbi:hypothetical protein Hanom_Chr07g00607161 [Helianthus anomalus]
MLEFLGVLNDWISGSCSPYMKVKSVPNWYLRSFGSANLVAVRRTIFSSLTTGFIRKKSLSYNFFG